MLSVPLRNWFALVPGSIGYHVAHHVDAGVPFGHLARYHQHRIPPVLRPVERLARRSLIEMIL
ncbi:MAG: fatty acid desaturase [Actinobacteria bacterium]|nr:fatty acid desaturase [Actinomycetota bacterium]